MTGAYLALCETLAGLNYTSGVPTKVEEGSMHYPVFDDAGDLPYVVVETTGEMDINYDGVPAQQIATVTPVRVWYVIPQHEEMVISDILRAEGDLIARNLWMSHLPYLGSDQCERVIVRGIDWSDGDSNPFNATAKEQGWPAAAVGVRLDIVAIESR